MPGSPFNSVKEAIAAAKAKPGQLSYGSGGGSGSSDHLAGELFKMLAGFTSLGVEAEGSTPSEFKTYFRNDVETWRKVVRAAGVSAE